MTETQVSSDIQIEAAARRWRLAERDRRRAEAALRSAEAKLSEAKQVRQEALDLRRRLAQVVAEIRLLDVGEEDDDE